MAISQKVPVLAAYKPFVDILTIYDSKIFTNKDHRRILARNILQAIIVAASVSIYIVGLSYDLLYCSGFNFRVDQIALQLGLFINALQIAITYVAIHNNNDLVNKVLNDCRAIVNERMYLFEFKKFPQNSLNLFYGQYHAYRM